MSRPIRLTAPDVAWLLTPSPGRVAGWQGEIMRTDAQPRAGNWTMESFADALASLPHPERTRSLNLVLTAEGLRIIAWAATENDLRAFTNQWTSCNPGLRAYPVGQPWMVLRPGSIVRLSQLRLNTGARRPIEYRFGRAAGGALRDSPTAHLWTSFPQVPRGCEVVVQLVWRRASPFWRLLPWTQFGILEGPVDKEAILHKQGFLTTFYLAVRIVEIHRDARHLGTHLAESIGHAFGIYDRDRGNGFHIDPLHSWPRSRTLRLLKTVLEHDAVRASQHGLSRPRLMPLEAASLLHPPPPGTEPAVLRRAPVAWREPPQGSATEMDEA